MRLPDLAATLSRLADAGAADLYAGELAQRLAGAVEAAGGLLSAEDLRGYRPDWTAPVAIRYGGLEVLTTPPNSQGVTALLMLRRMRGDRTRRGRSTTSTTSSPRSSTPSPCATRT